MSSPASNLVMRLVRGEGAPRSIAFATGELVAPFSVGRRGAWKVWSPGIEDVCFYAKYDGVTLSLRAAGTRAWPRVNGADLTAQWSEVRPPAVIQLDALCLLIEADEPRGAPARPPMATPPFARADDEDELLTRVMTHDRSSLGAAALKPTPTDVPTRIDLHRVRLPPASPLRALSAETPPTAASRAPPAPRRVWVALGTLPSPRRILRVLVPVMLALLGLRLTLLRATPRAEEPLGDPPARTDTANAVPSEPIGAVAVADGPAPSPRASVRNEAGGSARSLERQAADALALGDYASALVLYRRLAGDHPGNRAFVEAARIVAAKASGAVRPSHPRL